MAHPLISRVFMNGNSQAVRIPQELRLNALEVEISRTADGDLVIHPLTAAPENRGEALLQALHGFDPEFTALLEENQQEVLEHQEREPL